MRRTELGAWRGQVRSRGPQFGSESGSVWQTRGCRERFTRWCNPEAEKPGLGEIRALASPFRMKNGPLGDNPSGPGPLGRKNGGYAGPGLTDGVLTDRVE